MHTQECIEAVWATASIVLFLASCNNMQTVTQSLAGEDISVVVSKLGYPNEKREMLGHTIYRWNTGNPQGQGLGGMYCNLDVVVDDDNKIERGNWDGNNGGCEPR